METEVNVLIKHSDHDSKFQKEMLEQMKAHDADPQAYASLFDRIGLNEKGVQRYGTHALTRYDGEGGGKTELYPVEDMRNIDRLRSEIGLPALEAACKDITPVPWAGFG